MVVITPAGASGANALFTYNAVPPPLVTGISPNTGFTSGGTQVTITGATAVTIGGVAVTGMNVVNTTTITGTTGAHAAGMVNVAVTAAGGTGTGAGLFTYIVAALGHCS